MAQTIEDLPYRKRFAALFASLSIIAFSSIAVMNSFIVSGIEINSNLIVFMLKLSIPAALILGYLGYLIGRIFDDKTLRRKTQTNISQFTKKDLDEAYSIGSIFTESDNQENTEQVSLLGTQPADEEVKNEI